MGRKMCMVHDWFRRFYIFSKRVGDRAVCLSWSVVFDLHLKVFAFSFRVLNGPERYLPLYSQGGARRPVGGGFQMFNRFSRSIRRWPPRTRNSLRSSAASGHVLPEQVIAECHVRIPEVVFTEADAI